MVLNRGGFVPRGHLGMSGDIFGGRNGARGEAMTSHSNEDSLHHSELSSLKWWEGHGQETLIYRVASFRKTLRRNDGFRK